MDALVSRELAVAAVTQLVLCLGLVGCSSCSCLHRGGRGAGGVGRAGLPAAVLEECVHPKHCCCRETEELKHNMRQ